MIRLIRELIRPYRGKLLIILVAMLMETAMSLATPWPLKIIIDNVVGHHKLPHGLDELVRPMLDGGNKLQVAGLAALAFVVIALLGALASYIDNYYTESVGQWVAHDLRMRTYHHLQRLSLGYYNTHQTGTLLSTITTDIQTIQGFASSSTLDILVDLLTIVCDAGADVLAELGFHADCGGGHAFPAFFRFALQEGGKEGHARGAQGAVRDRGRGAAGAGIDAGGQGIRPRRRWSRRRLAEVSHATVDAALRARKVKSLLSPIVTITVAVCTAVVLWRGAALILTRGDDHRRFNGLSGIPHQVLQAGEGPGHDDQCDCAGRRGC